MSKQPQPGSTAAKAKAATNEAIEEIKVASNQLVDRVRDLIEEGNVRHVSIRKEGRTLLDVPLTVGVGAGAAAVLLSPMLAALGALAALVTDITLVIERDPDMDAAPGTSATANPAGDSASGDPTETPASKPVTPKGDGDKTIGK